MSIELVLRARFNVEVLAITLNPLNVSSFTFREVTSSSSESFQVHQSPFKFIRVLSSSSESFQVQLNLTHEAISST